MKPENPNPQEIKPKNWLKRNLGRVLITAAVIGAGVGAERIIVSNSNKPDNHPGIEVPSTFTETIDQAAQAALDHATGKDGTVIDYSSDINPVVIASETLFQATKNGTTVSDSMLSSLLENAIKPFDESTLTADVSLLWPLKNSGDQKIVVDKIAHTEKGGNIDGVIGPGVIIDWETRLTIPNKGQEIILPVPANAAVFRMISKNAINSDGILYTTDRILVCFTGPDCTNYKLDIYEEDKNGNYLLFSSDSILSALADVPKVDGVFNPFDSTLNIKGKVLSAETSILKTVNNNTIIGFSLRCDKKDSQPDFKFISSGGKLVYVSLP